MKCLNPVKYCRLNDGSVTHNFNVSNIRSFGFHPCGGCINCRLRKAQSWAIRMTHESKMHSSNSFLTLTYSDDKLPPNHSLEYSHVTNFIKRLRSALNDTPIKYYRVGEYGDQGGRPHYHLALFGYDFSESIVYKGKSNRLEKVFQKDDRTYYQSSFLTDCWSHGFAQTGHLDFNSAQYVAKYVTKKLSTQEYGVLQMPERSSSSKKFPLGLSWLARYYNDVYPHDYVVLNDKKYVPPRAYDDWMKIHKPDIWEQVKLAREENSSESKDFLTCEDEYDLYAKHVIQIQKAKTSLRDGSIPNLKIDDEIIRRKRIV